MRGCYACIAAIFGYELLSTGSADWLAPYAVFEFGFVIVLVAAARAGFASDVKDWRTVLRLIAILPIFVALVYALGFLSHLEAYHASHALALSFVYFYNFITLRRNEGLGGRIFRFSLFVLAAAFLEHAIIFIYLYNAGNAAAVGAILAPRELLRFHTALRTGIFRHGDVERNTDRPHSGTER